MPSPIQHTFALLFLGACAAPVSSGPGSSNMRDTPEDSAFGGKGHPVGAQVAEAETSCLQSVGARSSTSLVAEPLSHPAGILCRVRFKNLGRGTWIANLRAAPTASANRRENAPALTVTAEDTSMHDGSNGAAPVVSQAPLALTRASFGGRGEYTDHALRFQLDEPVASLDVVLEWPAKTGVRLDYVELFRPRENVMLSPGSGVLARAQSVDIDFPVKTIGTGGPNMETKSVLPDGVAVTCNGNSLTELLSTNAVRKSVTAYRAVYRFSPELLAAHCPDFAEGKLVTLRASIPGATSAAVYSRTPRECSFSPGMKRALVTAFVPFPVDATENESMVLLEAFDPAPLAAKNISVMRVYLPVEYGSAADIVTDLVRRCEPDMVINLGQGGYGISLEQNAYNVADTPGLPDNRGFLGTGERHEPGGPEMIATRLPVDAIRQRLQGESVDAWVALSTDAGRYICNQMFYRVLRATESRGIPAGFIHVHNVDAPAGQHLLEAAIEESLRAS